MSARCLLVALALAGLAGCSDRSHGPQFPSDEGRDAAADDRPTEEECQRFAAALVQAVNAQDAARLAKLLDWDVLLESATREIDVPPKFRQRFVADMKGDAKKPGALPRHFFELIGRGGKWRFLRRHSVGNEDRLLFRVTVPETEELNYHDVIVQRRTDGQMRGSDDYELLTGELLSRTTRRGYLLTVLRAKQLPAARLHGSERQLQAHFAMVERLNELARAGKSAEVVKQYDRMPPELQRDKNVLLTRLRAAQNLGEAEYREAFENLRTYLPDDPCLDLWAISYYQTKREFPRALSMIDRLEKTVGGEPYLFVLRAKVRMQAQDFAAARQAAQTAAQQEPTLLDAYLALAQIAAQAKDFAEAVKQLQYIEQHFKPAIYPIFKTDPQYAEFLKSPQYQEWIKAHPAP